MRVLSHVFVVGNILSAQSIILPKSVSFFFIYVPLIALQFEVSEIIGKSNSQKLGLWNNEVKIVLIQIS